MQQSWKTTKDSPKLNNSVKVEKCEHKVDQK